VASIFKAEDPEAGGGTFLQTACKIALHHNPKDHNPNMTRPNLQNNVFQFLLREV
jgi:hypothetical protein